MRKKYFNLSVLLLFVLAIGACKKEITAAGPGTTALTIVNGVIGNTGLLTGFSFSGPSPGVPYYSKLNSVGYGGFMPYTGFSGLLKLNLYQIPDTTPTSKPVYNLALDLPANTIHTLFLMGTAQDPDQLLTTDQLPYHVPADSTMGIRFINLSNGSAPVSINIKDKTSEPEVTNLPYKSITAFKSYPVVSAVNSYTFEFRDKATNVLLGSCILKSINSDGSGGTGSNLWRNRNFTIAFFGSAADDPLKRTMIIRYY